MYITFNNMHSNKKVQDEMYSLARELWPLHRSIMGTGTENTIKILQKKIKNLKIYKFKSGTKIYDWVVPKEWSIKDAWIKDSSGKKVLDLNKNNLHIVSYSKKIKKTFSLNELKKKNLHFYFKEECYSIYNFFL